MLNSSFEIHSVALCHRNTSFMKSHALQPSAMAKGVRNGANMWELRGRSASAGGELKKERLRPWEVERDDMKWPAGEGWKPL